MKVALHFPLPHSIVFNGKRYELKPYFDNVLKVFAVQKENDLTTGDKVYLSLVILVKSKVKLEFNDQVGLLNAIYDTLIDAPKKTDNAPPAFDFVQDAGYIYSSFYMDYGIDLYQEQGKLHWWKFIQLFYGLSDKCKIKQVIQIRTKPIPAPTKYNNQERLDLMQAKQYYALKYNDAERETNFVNGLRRMANIMQAMATKDGNNE
jgi:hypothetical protein